jgi:hypothetical protein
VRDRQPHNPKRGSQIRGHAGATWSVRLGDPQPLLSALDRATDAQLWRIHGVALMTTEIVASVVQIPAGLYGAPQ